MTKYTPSPWRACREGKCVCGLIWSTPEDMIVASLYYEKGEKCVAVDSEMWQANMSLIAAAPEMLELLQRLTELSSECYRAKHVPQDRWLDSEQAIYQQWLAAVEIVRKATGDE